MSEAVGSGASPAWIPISADSPLASLVDAPAGTVVSYGPDSTFGSGADGSGPNAAGLGPWASARLPASWRGVPFKVRESEIKRGRRQAVHEYPFRDDIWVEDLGRAPRTTALRGFLVGDDVDQQFRAMLAANEQPGPGTLVHPALGSLTVSLVDFAARDEVERGRVWQLEFVFVHGSERGAASTTIDGQSAAATASGNLTAAAGDSFASVGDAVAAPGAPGTLTGALSGLRQVGASAITDAQQVVRGVQQTVGGFVGTVNGLARDVSAVGNSVTGLAGNFGRFSLGARLGTIPGLTNVSQALGAANAAAASVGRLGATVNSLVGQL